MPRPVVTEQDPPDVTVNSEPVSPRSSDKDDDPSPASPPKPSSGLGARPLSLRAEGGAAGACNRCVNPLQSSVALYPDGSMTAMMRIQAGACDEERQDFKGTYTRVVDLDEGGDWLAVWIQYHVAPSPAAPDTATESPVTASPLQAALQRFVVCPQCTRGRSGGSGQVRLCIFDSDPAERHRMLLIDLAGSISGATFIVLDAPWSDDDYDEETDGPALRDLLASLTSEVAIPEVLQNGLVDLTNPVQERDQGHTDQDDEEGGEAEATESPEGDADTNSNRSGNEISDVSRIPAPPGRELVGPGHLCRVVL